MFGHMFAEFGQSPVPHSSKLEKCCLYLVNIGLIRWNSAQSGRSGQEVFTPLRRRDALLLVVRRHIF